MAEATNTQIKWKYSTVDGQNTESDTTVYWDYASGELDPRIVEPSIPQTISVESDSTADANGFTRYFMYWDCQENSDSTRWCGSGYGFYRNVRHCCCSV